MTMLGRRGLLKAAGLLPLAGGKHKKGPDVPWSNQQFQLLIVSAQAGGFSGAFFYSPAPGNGNLVASIASQAGTDPYGNHYLAGVTSYGPSPGDNAQLLNGTASFFSPATTVSPGSVGEAGGSDRLVLQSGQAAGHTQAVLQLQGGPSGTLFMVSGGGSPVTSALLEVAGDVALTEQSATPPTPTGAGVLYVDSTGHLHYLGPGGTNTILANP